VNWFWQVAQVFGIAAGVAIILLVGRK